MITCDACGRDFRSHRSEKTCSWCGYDNGPGELPRTEKSMQRIERRRDRQERRQEDEFDDRE